MTDPSVPPPPSEQPPAFGRRPTIQDVADAAGVSRALVSIVFRDVPGASVATRERVREVAARLGYRPDRRARLLRQSRTRTIGVSYGIREAFHEDLVEALYLAAATRDFSLSLSASTSSRSEDEAVESLLDDRPEAIVLLGSTLEEERLAALRDRLPVVVVARSASGVVDSVHTDDRAGAALAMRHLLELGHRDIAYLHAPSAAGADARLAGFLDEAVRCDRSRILEAGADEESGVRAASAMLAGGEGLPTAAFAFNDRCAFGLLDTFLRRGVRVPDDVSVIGYDNSQVSQSSVVGLSTVAQDPIALAGAALDSVISVLDGARRAPRDVVLPPTLIIRSTTAARRPDSPS